MLPNLLKNSVPCVCAGLTMVRLIAFGAGDLREQKNKET